MTLTDTQRGAPWLASAALVTVLHGGALAVAVLWHSQVAPPPAPATAMLIELSPMAAPAPPSDKAPGVEQQAARPMEKLVEDLPEIKPVVEKAAVRLPKPVPRPKPRQLPPIETPPADKVVDQATAPEAAEAPPAAKSAAPIAGASTPAPPSNAVPTWQGALRAHLERHKRYPAAAQFHRQQGVAAIRFAMTRDGTVVTAQLERGSGHARLDEEALALLQRAQPLPAPPSEVAGEPIEIIVPIQFFLRP